MHSQSVDFFLINLFRVIKYAIITGWLNVHYTLGNLNGFSFFL